MITNGTSTELGRLLKKHIDDLMPYTLDLSKKNIDFINSLGITSATVASFSLLTLQIPPSVFKINQPFLIYGFITLTVNVLFAFLISRVWIDIEERPIKQSLESLKLEEELFLISRIDPQLQQEENRSRWQEIIADLKQERSKRRLSFKERQFQNKATNLLGKTIYINLAIFAIGIFMISAAFICK